MIQKPIPIHCKKCGAIIFEGEFCSAHTASPEKEASTETTVKGQKELSGVSLIAAERVRQVTQEGWSAEHDSGHDKGQLAMAGAAYAYHSVYGVQGGLWPWDQKWWKPGAGRTLDTRIRALTKAGALIAAEIDRLLRLKSDKKEGEP